MKRKKVRLAVLLFMLFNLMLAACAQSRTAPANTPLPTQTPRAGIDSQAPEAAPEPTPEPAPEPDEGWREAYAAAAGQFEQEFPQQGESSPRILYELIDFDGGETPELAACLEGYCVSLYAYRDGETYMLMDRWAYGAMGNMGYEYCPGKNSLRNFNTDFAGLILYTTYMSIGPEMTMDMTAQIETYNFDDANRNGSPDEDEYDSAYEVCVSYCGGEEISPEDAAAFDAGEYEFIKGVMSYTELLTALEK